MYINPRFLQKKLQFICHLQDRFQKKHGSKSKKTAVMRRFLSNARPWLGLPEIFICRGAPCVLRQ